VADKKLPTGGRDGARTRFREVPAGSRHWRAVRSSPLDRFTTKAAEAGIGIISRLTSAILDDLALG